MFHLVSDANGRAGWWEDLRLAQEYKRQEEWVYVGNSSAISLLGLVRVFLREVSACYRSSNIESEDLS